MDAMEIINSVLAICGGISIIGGAVAVVWKWVRPAMQLKDRVDKLETKADNDFAAINDIKTMNAATCQALIAIIDHELTGNSVEGLKKTKNDLIKLITESC